VDRPRRPPPPGLRRPTWPPLVAGCRPPRGTQDRTHGQEPLQHPRQRRPQTHPLLPRPRRNRTHRSHLAGAPHSSPGTGERLRQWVSRIRGRAGWEVVGRGVGKPNLPSNLL
jgi:hypothetical protein